MFQHPTRVGRTVGLRRTINRPTLSLADIIRPWVAFEAWELVHQRRRRRKQSAPDVLETQIQNDFTLRPPLQSTTSATQPASVHDVACLLVCSSLWYKRCVMVFRRIVSALLPHNGGTRPGPEYRIPVLQRIAAVLHGHYQVQPMIGSGYRTPLRVVFETAYAGVDTLRPGEMAQLFLMLAEAAGIPCALLVEQLPSGEFRLLVLCKVVPGEGSERAPTGDAFLGANDLLVYDPLTGALNQWHGSFGVTAQWLYPIDEPFRLLGPVHIVEPDTCVKRTNANVRMVTGRMGDVPHVLQQVMHRTGFRAAPEWARPASTLVGTDWFQRLIHAYETFDANEIHAPFLIRQSQMTQGPGARVAENFGPDITGGIIAFAARIYSRRYTDIFRDLVQWIWATAAKQSWYMQLSGATRAYHERMQRAPVEDIIFDVAADGPAALGEVFGEWVRHALPYCEETIAVEEITGPLAALVIIAHYPGIQKFDCDDVSLFWMTGMESVIASATQLARSVGRPAPTVMTAVRLAGDPPEPSVPIAEADKYHVYPLLSYGQRVHVFDVSNPAGIPLNDELEHGGNEESRWPQIPSTWLGLFYPDVELQTPQIAAAAGRRIHRTQSAYASPWRW